MRSFIADLIARCKKRGAVHYDLFEKLLIKHGIDDEVDTVIALLQANGLEIEESHERFFLPTMSRAYETQNFCIVDIETNGSKPTEAQIIEIAAVKIRDGQIIDRFQSLVYNDYIPDIIMKITGITIESLQNAPIIEDILKDFKAFIDDDVFIAHGVSFDYNFIDFYLQKHSLGMLFNQKICTHNLCKKLFDTPKYSLSFFNEYLGINQDSLHRAYSDVIVNYEIFKACLAKLPSKVKSTQEVISFCYS